MDQFGPLQIRNLEQLVPLLAINDHFVPKKHQSTFRFHQKEHKEDEQAVLAFREGTIPKSRKGTAPKNKMCSKTSLVKWEKAKKRLKDHSLKSTIECRNFTGRNEFLDMKT